MRYILTLAVCFVLLSAAVAHAQGGIAVFDLQKVAGESDVQKEALAALEQSFGPEKAELEKEKEAIEALAKKYAEANPTEQQKKDFEKRLRAYSDREQAFLRLLQNAELRVRKDIDTVIETAAKQLAERKGYILVLDSVVAPYSDPKLDVTNDMITETNKIWKDKPAGN